MYQRTKADNSDFRKAESEFLFSALADLPTFVTAFGFQPIKSDQRNQLDFKKGDTKITLHYGKKRWVWCYPGQKATDAREKGGLLSFLVDFADAADYKDGFKLLREYAKSNHYSEYENFVNDFKRKNPGKYALDLNSISTAQPYIPQAVIQTTEPNRQKKENQIFAFEPAKDLSVMTDRAISENTINLPIFKGRFGNASGTFGNKQDGDSMEPTPEIYKYPNHLIIPLTDVMGNTIGLEAKNRLSDEAFEKKLARQYDDEQDIRRNPSKIYPGSNHGDSFWIGNIPQQVDALIIGEQPLDMMSFFQLNGQDDELMNRTIAMTTGGAVTNGQLSAIHQFVDKYNIKTVRSVFDNDQHGLKYFITLVSSLAGAADKNLAFSMVTRADDQLQELVFRATKEGEAINGLHENVKALIAEYNINGEYLPSISAPEKSNKDMAIGTLYFKYNTENKTAITKMTTALSSSSIAFYHETPSKSKDWNDALLGIEEAAKEVGQFVLDTEANRNRLFIDNRYNVLLIRRYVSAEQPVKDTVATFNPFGRKYFVKPVLGMQLPETVTRELDAMNRAYSITNKPITNEWLYQQLMQGIVFERGQFLKNGNPIAVIDPASRLPILSANYEHTKEEVSAIFWMTAAANKGVAIKPILTLEYRDVYFNRLDNGDISFTGNAVVKNMVVAEYDNGKQKWITKDIPYKITDLAVAAYVSSIPDSAQAIPPVPAQATGLSVDFGTGKITVAEPLFYYKNNQWEANVVNAATEADKKIFNRISNLIEKGLDPNRPGYIGRVSDRLTLQFAKNYHNALTKAGKDMLFILESALDRYRKNMASFLGRYEEPYLHLASENLILQELASTGRRNIVRYDHRTNTLEWLIPNEELTSRGFNKQFWKVVSLFQEQGGIYNNYIRNIKFSKEGNLYYRNPQAPIGKLVKMDGKFKVALNGNLPANMKRELEYLLPFEKATEQELKNIDISLVESHIKEKNASKVPLEYTPFFNRAGRMDYKNSQELESLRARSTKAYDRYIEAELWSMSQSANPKGQENPLKKQPPTIRDVNGTIKYGRVDVAKYNPEKDAFEFAFAPDRPFYPQIGLLEKIYVKDPANRKYAEYITEQALPRPTITETEIRRQLAQTEVTGPKEGPNEVFILHKGSKYFERKKIADIVGRSLLLDADMKTFSPFLEQSMAHLAAKLNLKVELTELEQKVPAQMQVSSPSFEKKRSIEHELLLGEDKLLKAFDCFPSLKGLTKNHNNMIVVKESNAENSGYYAFEKEAKNGNYLSPFPSAHKYNVFAESPSQLLLWAQKNYHLAIHDQVYMASVGSLNGPELRYKYERYAKIPTVAKTVFVGSETFLNEIGDPIRKSGTNVELLSAIELDRSLDSLRAELGQHNPDIFLANIQSTLTKNSLYATEGVAIVPMQSEGLNSFGVLAAKDKPSGDVNSIWISSPLKNAESITIVQNVREAMSYLHINSICEIGYQPDFNAKNPVIAFNCKEGDQPTQKAIDHVVDLIRANVRIANNTRIANSNGLAEALFSKGFPQNVAIVTPENSLSFSADVTKMQQTQEEADKELKLLQVRPPQKSRSQNWGNEPALAQTHFAQGHIHKQTAQNELFG